MDFYSITQWIYPLLDLIIMVMCFTMLRGTGGILLGFAFLIMAVSSLSWPLFDWLGYNDQGNTGDYFFDLGSVVAFIAYFTSSLLIIFGIVNLASTMRPSTVSGEPLVQPQNGNPYQAPAANIDQNYVNGSNGFGNILFYLIPYLIGIALIMVGVGVLLNTHNPDTSILIMLLGLVFILVGSIYLLVVVYRLWAFIIYESNQLGLTPAIRSPGQAVGFLFIPLFNFYWLFLVYGKMADNINAIAQQRGATHLMPEGLGKTIPILVILTIIPYLGLLISLVLGLALIPIFISQAIRMSTSLNAVNQPV